MSAIGYCEQPLSEGLRNYANGAELLLVGDGSGTRVGNAAAWTVFCLDMRSQAAYWHAGAVSSGTNNYAELHPYVHALWDYQSRHRVTEFSPVQVRIVSDSQITVRCGNGDYLPSANLPYWAAIEQLKKSGFNLDWVHIPRNSHPLHELADYCAGKTRNEMSRVYKSINFLPELIGNHTDGNNGASVSLCGDLPRGLRSRLAELLQPTAGEASN